MQCNAAFESDLHFDQKLQLLADVLKQRGEEVDVLRENARLGQKTDLVSGVCHFCSRFYGITPRNGDLLGVY